MENYTDKLEEAANAFASSETLSEYENSLCVSSFVAGAEWQKENMWISVEENLPPCSYNDLFLLGIDSEGNVDVVDIGYMHHGKDNIPRIDLFVSGELVKVTHWMPIPEIKKGE